MKRKSNQQGFSIAILLVVIVVLAGLVLAGWYVWKKNRKDNTSNKTSTSQTNQKDDKKQMASDPSEGGKYLVISEWGVRFPLSSDISEAYYEFTAGNLSDGVALYDGAFDRMENANGISCGGSNRYQLYSMSRVRPENLTQVKEEEPGAGPEYQKFPFTEEYVFGGLGPSQAPPGCADLSSNPYGPFQEDQNILDIANDKEQAFDRAFKNLQEAR